MWWLLRAAFEFLEGRERFAEFPAQFRRRFPQGCQYLVLAGCLLSCTRQRRLIGTVQGLESQNVARAKLRNRAFNEGPGALSRADLPRHIFGDARVRRETHQAQGLAHLPVGENVQEG
jgi:hypothetical protein